jgi:hypothetical protein
MAVGASKARNALHRHLPVAAEWLGAGEDALHTPLSPRMLQLT